MEFYADKVTKSGISAPQNNSSSTTGSHPPNLDLTSPTLSTTSDSRANKNQVLATGTDLLSDDLFQLDLSDTNSAMDSTVKPSISLSSSGENPQSKHTRGKYEELEDIFSNLTNITPVAVPTAFQATPIVSATVPAVGSTPSQPMQQQQQPCYQSSVLLSSGSVTTGAFSESSTKTKLFDELDSLGRQIFGLDNGVTTGKPTQTPDSDKRPSVNVSPSRVAPLLPEQSVVNGSTDPANTTTPVNSQTAPTQCSPSRPSTSSVDLSSLDVQLSAIEPHPRIRDPHPLYPLNTTDETAPGVRLHLHYAVNRPAPDVSVFVAVVTNRSTLPVSELLMRFGVNKPLQLRHLTASGQSLSAYSPFLPTGAINQVILIYDPVHNPTFNLKFQLSFNLGDEAILESGSLSIPSA
ncbi:unnamed protein product [Echinostoma caproni]|uniref:GAE domain-containing protein n=1 Tax=Echinostoma caproni TaxID=27848 RepID=A0A3P8HPR8_9TREM|nr:unnamed protein product [Echinostoma caproni]